MKPQAFLVYIHKLDSRNRFFLKRQATFMIESMESSFNPFLSLRRSRPNSTQLKKRPVFFTERIETNSLKINQVFSLLK